MLRISLAVSHQKQLRLESVKANHAQDLEASISERASHAQELEGSISERVSHAQDLEASISERASHAQDQRVIASQRAAPDQDHILDHALDHALVQDPDHSACGENHGRRVWDHWDSKEIDKQPILQSDSTEVKVLSLLFLSTQSKLWLCAESLFI